VYAPVRTVNHSATLADQRAALERVRVALAAGGRFAFNPFVPGFEVVAETYGDPVEGRVGVDGADYHIVSTTLVDEAERVARRHRELYRDGDLIAERGTPLALIPKRQFEFPFADARFADWAVYGGFDRVPLESAGQEMVRVVEA
jgi:hypothetical protein